jgi:hypothetical protein
MMQTLFWKAAAPIVCALMTASCAGSSRTSPVAPARLILPETASRPCALATLPAEPTLADLEAAYMLRGAQVVACDGARRLAVETLLAERAMQTARRTPAAP